LILDVQSFGRHGTDPTVALLRGLREKHDRSETAFLVDGYDYQTALVRSGPSGWLDYVERNLIEKRFHAVKMRLDRFHHSWVGSRASARERIEQYVHYHTHQRAHRALDGRTPGAEVFNYSSVGNSFQRPSR
jgi:putative transposase